MSEQLGKLARRYRDFADWEAKGQSSAYFQLASAIAADEASLELLLALPPPKRQPNLVFACIRRFGLPTSALEFRILFERHGDQIKSDISSKRTQTNEPARCAALYLALSTIEGPISLIELGASAGLCMIPDAYRYRFNDKPFEPATASLDAPEIRCSISGPAPRPRRALDICWRQGIDLNPIDLSSDDQTGWLETLVWPGQDERLSQLRAALRVARRRKPSVKKGDLTTGLDDLVSAAPVGTTIVVYHSAVMNYLEWSAVRTFEQEVAHSDAVWLSVEDPRLFPAWLENKTISVPKGRFLIAMNGQPLGHAHPHGGDVLWF